MLVISSHNSFRVLSDKVASVYLIWKMYLYFSSKNGQPREPARCQLYRRAENFYFLVLLEYTAQQRLCDYALYKSTIDTDTDISFTIHPQMSKGVDWTRCMRRQRRRLISSICFYGHS